MPPSYLDSEKSYPVVYYFHNVYSNPDQIFKKNNLADLMERGFDNNVVKELIFVAADFSSPTTGSMYENSITSGRWLDFITNELVPFIDKKFRTLNNKNSRALVGHFMGGRGAFKLAMLYPNIFGMVYALHPVATGSGYLPRNYISIDWEKIHEAKSFKELDGTGRTQFFTAICQAFLPNPNRPPFYCDFHFETENGELKYNPVNARKEQKGFHLDETLDEYAENLRSMKAITFDWGRFDETQAHVISNRRFSKKLEELGIAHEAEEFNGNPFDQYWKEYGRFYTRILPFLARNLVFENSK